MQLGRTLQLNCKRWYWNVPSQCEFVFVAKLLSLHFKDALNLQWPAWRPQVFHSTRTGRPRNRPDDSIPDSQSPGASGQKHHDQHLHVDQLCHEITVLQRLTISRPRSWPSHDEICSEGGRVTYCRSCVSTRRKPEAIILHLKSRRTSIREC